MIDIKLIRTHIEEVKRGVAAKGYDPARIDALAAADIAQRELVQREEVLRRTRNELAARGADPAAREQAIEVKKGLQQLSEQLAAGEAQVATLLASVPNLPLAEVPVGAGDSANVEVRTWGEKPTFSFTPKNHLEIGERLGILNFEAGSKVAGSQFYYLDNEGVLLELALIQFGLDLARREGFAPTMTPDLAKSRFYLGTGYLPRGDEAQTYEIQGEDLGLIATAEVTIAGRHADEVIPESELPIKYAGVSHCFRREAGAYGKYSKGLYRVHQFSKLELFAYCTPEESAAMHAQILSLEEKIWQALGIPYRVLEMCTGDLGAIAARKYDLEAWMPGRADGVGEYGEITSTSNCTDYQARNLNIRVKRSPANGGKTEYLHMLNGTAIAISRAIVAILENFQQADGSVVIPEALRPFMLGIDRISSKK